MLLNPALGISTPVELLEVPEGAVLLETLDELADPAGILLEDGSGFLLLENAT